MPVLNKVLFSGGLQAPGWVREPSLRGQQVLLREQLQLLLQVCGFVSAETTHTFPELPHLNSQNVAKQEGGGKSF